MANITKINGNLITAQSASFATTASYALSSPGGGGLSGGTTNYIPLWTGATSQGSSIMSYNSTDNEIINSGSLYVSGTLYVGGEIEGIQGQVTSLARTNYLFSGF